MAAGAGTPRPASDDVSAPITPYPTPPRHTRIPPTSFPRRRESPRPMSDDVFMGTPWPPQGYWVHSQDGAWRARPDSRLRGNDGRGPGMTDGAREWRQARE